MRIMSASLDGSYNLRTVSLLAHLGASFALAIFKFQRLAKMSKSKPKYAQISQLLPEGTFTKEAYASVITKLLDRAAIDAVQTVALGAIYTILLFTDFYPIFWNGVNDLLGPAFATTMLILFELLFSFALNFGFFIMSKGKFKVEANEVEEPFKISWKQVPFLLVAEYIVQFTFLGLYLALCGLMSDGWTMVIANGIAVPIMFEKLLNLELKRVLSFISRITKVGETSEAGEYDNSRFLDKTALFFFLELLTPVTAIEMLKTPESAKPESASVALQNFEKSRKNSAYLSKIKLIFYAFCATTTAKFVYLSTSAKLYYDFRFDLVEPVLGMLLLYTLGRPFWQLMKTIFVPLWTRNFQQTIAKTDLSKDAKFASQIASAMLASIGERELYPAELTALPHHSSFGHLDQTLLFARP